MTPIPFIKGPKDGETYTVPKGMHPPVSIGIQGAGKYVYHPDPPRLLWHPNTRGSR